MADLEQLPAGYQVIRYIDAPSRWIVSYKGDPFFFMERINAQGEQRIKTFKTKHEARQAVTNHANWIAQLEAQSQATAKLSRE